MSVQGSDQGQDGVADPNEDLGTDEAAIVTRWKMELEAARKGPYQRWLKRAKQAIKRFRDEEMDSGDGAPMRRNAQFNVLWSNVNTVAPSVYSRAAKPICERRYLDRDALARAGATIMQRSLSYAIEDSGMHETMMQCRTDYFLVAMGSAWVRYEAEYDKTAPQHQENPPEDAPRNMAQAQAYTAADKVTQQKLCVDYCHWSDDLVSPARFWSEVTWRAKRAYYTRRQLRDRFPREIADEVPLKVTRGRKQNDVTDQVREVIGKAEVWQIWDMEAREIIWVCEDYAIRPLKVVKDGLKLSCFVPAARPVRATTTNDSFWPIPDYSIWHDQAAELDNLTARIAALTRAIKAVGVFDASQPELERMLNEGMENKLIGVKNWAKLVQRGGLDGSVGLLPIKEMADALTALYLARSQVKNDLYEISGVSDIVRGSSDPNETAAAQKMKGQFSNVRGSDRKNEFNRFVRDTLVIMGEMMLEHFTDDQLWLMSDFEQWFKDQDARSYGPDQPQVPPPMVGHNGAPPLDDMPAPMPYMQPGEQGPSGAVDAPAAMGVQPLAPVSPLISDQKPAMAPPVGGVPVQQPGAMPRGAPMPPPMPGIPFQQPPIPTARSVFTEALELLRKDKLRSFRIQVETNSTIEPDATEERQARIEFLGTVTQFLAQAQEMAAAYPQIMPVLGKMLLFGARGFSVGRELESSLEGMVSDLERMAKNPAPKPPSPEEIKAQALKDKAATDQQKAQVDLAADQERLKMEMQKLQMEMQMERERMEMEREKLMMQLEGERMKQQLKAQGAQQDAAIKQQQGQQELALSAQRGQIEADGMVREAAHQERTLERTEAHDETRMELAEEGARRKAAAAGKPSAGNGKG